MPNLITELIVDRVDLVEEGANSAAFIELYKRREPNKNMTLEEIMEQMQPEHVEVLKAKLAENDTVVTDLAKAKEDLGVATQAKEDVEKELKEVKEKLPCDCDGEADEKGTCKSCGKPKVKKAKSGAAFDESEVIKGLPAEAQAYLQNLRTQKETAEEAVRKSIEDKANSDAVIKAAELKNLPIEPTVLINVLKGASKDVIDVLDTLNSAIDVAVLGEIGKSNVGSKAGSTDSNLAWAKIENEATKLAKANGITQQKAVSEVIKSKPQLYRDYLEGGAE